MKDQKELLSSLTAERNLLDEKIIKLSNFIYSPEFLEIKKEEKWLLTEQLRIMQSYDDVLRKRLESNS